MQIQILPSPLWRYSRAWEDAWLKAMSFDGSNPSASIMRKNCYTGVGSRETPMNILKVVRRIANILRKEGWILRSGGARGADTHFEKGALNKKEIFHPHKDYDCWDEAKDIAQQHHPMFNKLTPTSQKYIIRNTFQVLGRDLENPSSFVICWTSDGAVTDSERSKETGGTGQVISIADTYDIPLYNLSRSEHRDVVLNHLTKKEISKLEKG